MRVRIHRGAHEIGGSCVEVEHGGSRIVMDVGRPLSAGWGEDVALPLVSGLSDRDPEGDCLGVLITHHHADHWGLVDQVRAGLPIFMGAATERILRSAAFWSMGLDTPVAGHLAHRSPFQLGPFTITPYLNDHSAYDAYSLLVEAGGARLFYTGDIRGHGRKARLFEELLEDPPEDVDVLLMEGTNLQPGLPPKPTMSESDVEQAMTDTFRATHGMALVVTSAQNIDRLVTTYRATLQADRDLVMDPYTADIARATGNDNIPRPSEDWPRVHAFMPRWQSIRVKEAKAFSRLDQINPYRLFHRHLAMNPSRYVLLFSADEGIRLAEADALVGASCTYSLWSGYLDESRGQRLRAFLDDHNVPLFHHHTSGHASEDDLRRLANALDADRVVPIHTFGPDEYARVTDRTEIRPDGEWWSVPPDEPS